VNVGRGTDLLDRWTRASESAHDQEKSLGKFRDGWMSVFGAAQEMPKGPRAV